MSKYLIGKLFSNSKIDKKGLILSKNLRKYGKLDKTDFR